MKVRKAIFDKRFSEKKTIMALYATKKAFSDVAVFGDYVQNRNQHPFGHFFRGKKADPHFTEGCENSLIEVCTGFGLS